MGRCASGSGRCSCIAGRCRRRVGRRWRGGRTGCGSGRRSREGCTTEDAAVGGRRVVRGRDPVVPSRWRHATARLAPTVSGRYLSFAEREEIAHLPRAGARGAGDRPAARSVAVDDLA